MAQEHVLGQILVDLGFATKDDVEAAVERANGSGQSVGEVLREEGKLGEIQLRWALMVQRTHRGQAEHQEVTAFAEEQRAAFFEDIHDMAEGVRDLTGRLKVKKKK